MSKGHFLIAVLGCSLICACDERTGKTPDEVWGNALNGLQLRIWTDGSGFHGSDPIILRLSFRNASSETISIWQSGFWPNTTIQVVDARKKPAKRTHEGILQRDTFSPAGERSVNYKVALKPGEQYKLEPVDLRRSFELQPGSVYCVEVTYEEWQKGGWTGRLISNKIRLELTST